MFGALFGGIPWLDATFGEGDKPADDSLGLLAAQVFGIFITAFGVLGLVLTGRLEFDRDARRVRRTWFFGVTRWSRPLLDVRAVQVIPGEPSTRGEGDSAKLAPTYQLNLVLADPKRPRVNLTSRFDWAGTIITARRIAEFLRVPLLDAISPTLAKVYGVMPIRMTGLIAELASKVGVEPRLARRALGAFLAHLRKSADPDEFDTLMAALPEGQAVIDEDERDPGNAPIGFARRFAAVMTGIADWEARNRVRLVNRLARAGLSDPQIEAFLGATTDRLRDVLPLEFVPLPVPRADPPAG